MAAMPASILQRRQLAKPSMTASFLPVTIRGEMPGRAMSDYLRCQVAFANSLRASRAFALRMTSS
ncbi:hypothetical protein RFN29_35005, partial [Mesorhizobium sp. VK22B]|nr:hypothetical protein [Mesorhizobium sp. VK22B]